MRLILWRLGVSIAAFLGGVVGFVPVFVVGLSVPFEVTGPLSLGTGILLAALAAGWVGNIAPSAPQQRTRSRLLPILAASGVGLVLALLVGVAFGFALFRLFPVSDLSSGVPPRAYAIYGAFFATLALAASFATWRYRGPRVSGLGSGGVTSLALSIFGLVVLLLLVPVMGSGFDPGGIAGALVAGGFAVTLVLAALGAVSVVRNSRWSPEGVHALGWDAALTLALVGGWTATIFGAVYLTCLLVTCQP